MASNVQIEYKLLQKRPLSNGMGEETRWRFPSILWIPLIVCGCLLFIVDVFQLQYYSIIPSKIDSYISGVPTIPPQSLKGFVVKTQGCRIPDMDPFDQTIKQFILKEKKPVCNKGKPALYESDLDSIYILDQSIGYYIDLNTTSVDSLKCCYRPFHRRDPNDDENDDKITYSRNCIKFVNRTKIHDEFIVVQCDSGNGKLLYKDLFSFVPLKNLSHIVTNRNNERKPNLLIVGIDAVSRLNFHRQMPKTIDYLLKQLNAIELLGYNKVADNTFPNLIPFLTGLSEEELKPICWKEENDKFDSCPFVWNDFKSKGYVTSFSEDSAWMGIFNYMRRGFKKQPTDYSYGIFNRIAERQIGNSHNMNVQECVGAREVYKVFLEHIKRFTVRMDLEHLPYFSFNWGSSLTHDYLNKGSLGDSTYLDFFQSLKNGNHLNNTILIVMSDHGIRWGDIRQTFQGRMEERLPFIFISLPDWFKSENRQAVYNLIKNTRKLTTPYDMHETLKDLLNPQNISVIPPSRLSRGYSLFTEITSNRTCEDAGIASHWCTCQHSFEIDKTDGRVIKIANYAVDYINRQLDGYAQCATLQLKSIYNARLMSHGDDILNGNKVEDYTLAIQTVPGEGVFEVTVRSSVNNKTMNEYEVMGTISRLNLYGKQSACITDFHLKLYCYFLGPSYSNFSCTLFSDQMDHVSPKVSCTPQWKCDFPSMKRLDTSPYVCWTEYTVGAAFKQ